LHEQLTLLESTSLTVTVLDDSNNAGLLVLIIIKLKQNWAKSITYSITDSCNIVRTELEEHRQKLVVNKVLLKELGILTKIGSKYLLQTPLSLGGIIEGLYDVLHKA